MTIECSNPYPGPESFARGDIRPYFGRDQETGDLTSLAVTERLLAFYAPSGAGKTSLLNKRVIPRLEEKLYEVLPTARVSGAASLPAGVRNVYAYNLMLRLAPNTPQPERFATLSLSDFLWHLSTEDGKAYHYDPSDQALRKATPARDLWPRVLILDQFEEIVTAYPTYWSHREDFFRQLDDALSSDAMLRVIMSLRSDYVQDLERYAGLLQHGLRARYQMFLMGVDDAHLAIEGPAAACGRTFEPGVAQQLVRNMSQVREQDIDGKIRAVPGETVEPIQLQVVCYQLWESMKQAPGDKIEMKDLQRLARAAMATRADSDRLTQRQKYELLSVFVDGALGAFYETALEKARTSAAAHVDEAFLRNWFSTQLITEGGSRGFMQRGHDDTGGVPDEVVQKLVDNHLLRSDTRGSIRLVELIHDRFVEPVRAANLQWNERRRREQPWIDAAYRWHESGASPETRNAALLLADLNLKTVLHDTAGHQFEPLVAEYLAASKEAQEKREQTAALEAERTRVKEAEAHAAAEKRFSRWMRGLTAVAVLMAIVAFVAWAVVFGKNKELGTTTINLETAIAASNANAHSADIARRQADDALTIARSLELANQSLELANQSLDTDWDAHIADALLLAHVANHYSPTLLANTALLAALDRSYRTDGADSGAMTAYVPRESLALAADGPWAGIAFSADGSLLALGDDRGGITLWDAATDAPISSRLAAHGEYPVHVLAFDPTGPRLISATQDRNNPTSPDHELVLWDLADPGNPAHRVLAANQPSIWSAAWSADGRRLAVANQDGTVDLWENLASSQPISRTLPGRHADAAVAAAFSPDGGWLASAGLDGKVILWSDIASSLPVPQTLADHTAGVNAVAFSPDGAHLASGSSDGTLRLWDLTQEPPASRVVDDRIDQGAQVWSLAFEPDNSRLLAAGWSDGSLRVHDVERPDAEPWRLAGHTGPVNSLVFDPANPQRLVSVSPVDLAPMAWSLSQRSEFASVQPFSAPVTADLLAMSPGGRWLAVAGDAQTVFVGEGMSASPAITLSTGMKIQAAALSANGNRLALAGCKPSQDAGPPATATATPTATATAAPSRTPGGLSSANNSLATPTTATPTPKPGGPSPADTPLSDCMLTIWSVDPALPITRTHTVTSSQPIVAVAFRPGQPDQLAMATELGELGEVQTYDLSTPQLLPVYLSKPIPEIVDLAFTSDGQRLAALSSSGLLKVWDWASQALVQEYSFESSEDKKFDAVEFVADDAWLALASNTHLELWEMGTEQPVETFEVKTGAADLVFDPTGDSLTWLQPHGLVRWPMDPAAWLELACTRAGRNLSYDAWRVAFPADAGKDKTDSALVCDPLIPALDRSFADALVTEARQAIEDCTTGQLDEGMDLLTAAKTITVTPPLRLDPLQIALEVLGDRAWYYLDRPGRQYDSQARECLQRAADAPGSPGFDVQQALDAGQKLVQAVEQLADPLADAGQIVDGLEEIREANAPWPDDFLQERTLTLLPDAYYRLCQQGDDTGCQRFADVADLLQYGDTVASEYQTGVEKPFYFQGQRGQAVTIAMNAVNNAFDTEVRLEGPEGRLTSNDDNGIDVNSLISNFMLPRDGIYRIIPGAYRGQGSYRLSLQVSNPRPVAVGVAERSSTAQDSLWRFEGQAGQLVAISQETTDLNFDPYLTLYGSDLAQLRTDDDSGWNYNALIVTTLPKDGAYYLNAGRANSQAPYSLSVTEPRPLPFDRPQTSAVVSDTLWVFDGAASQVVNLTISPAEPDMTTRLSLLDTYGSTVASGVASPSEGYERIPAFILPNDGRLVVQVGPAGDETPYTLTLTGVEPRPLTFGQTVTSTTRTDPIWTLSGAAGQVVDIALNGAEAAFDPELHLLDASGAEVAYDFDSGGDMNARIAALPLPANGQYFVKPLPADRPISYTLTLSEVAPQNIALGETATSTLRETALWAFDGTAGQPIDVEVAGATGETASVALWTEAGQELTSGGQFMRDSGSNAIDGYILPRTGRYLVRIGGLFPATRYDLTVAEARTRAIEPDAVATSTTVSDTLWTVDADAGQVLDITMSTTNPAFDPYLTVYDANGASLASDDDGGGSLNARISMFVAPATGRYVLRAGRPSFETVPYTLSVRDVQPPQIMLGETKRSTTRADELWRFAGQAGQVVTIDLTGWLPNGFDPYLILFGANGERLTENDNSASDDYNARVANFLLPQTGTYYIQTGRPGSASPYELSLKTLAATPAVPDSRFQVTQSGAYALPIDRPMRLRISADQPVDLALVGPGGEMITSRAPAILRRLDATGAYTVGVGMPVGASPRWLAIERVLGTPRPLAVETETINQLRPGETDLWSLIGDGQRAVRVTATAASFMPHAELWAPSGELLTSGEDVIGILTAGGESLLTVRATDVRASGPYTLTVQPMAITPGPEACNAASGATDYLPVRQGSVVILGRQRPIPRDTAWDPARNVYLGRPARVTSLAGPDWLGCPVVYVDIDQGQNLWRVRDMAVVE